MKFEPKLYSHWHLLIIPENWSDGIKDVLDQAPIFIRVCWLKTVAGAWCTTARLHTGVARGCVFGCIDSNDTICHYLQCPILWSLACAAMHASEESFFVVSRLGFVEPSACKLRLLAFCHALYHAVINDPACIVANGRPACSRVVQNRAFECCRNCLHMVGGRM